jgi:hypothetical protein
MIRIYADFNDQDEQGRVRLDTVGSLRDIEMHRNVLIDGMRVILYTPDEFEVEGILIYDEMWRGVADYTTIRYLDVA